ncbi:MAG: GGDEF domain-containing protein [Candidatus Levyibacteriota bacterium]
MSDIQSPEQPEQKESKIPQNQARVQGITKELNKILPNSDPVAVNRIARSQTAKDMRIERLREREKSTKKLSVVDSVTGLPNRRWMEEQLKMRTSQADRIGLAFKILIMDYDKFKFVNDGYGHPVGDDILRSAKLLDHRTSEPIARWGGDEFLQIINMDDKESYLQGLFHVVSAHASKISMVTRNILENRSYSPDADPKNKLKVVRISGGVADYHPGDKLEDVIKLADQALYKAKHTRNHFVQAKRVGEKIIFENIMK